MASISGALTGWLLYAALFTCYGSLAGRFLVAPRGVEPGAAEGASLRRAGGRLAIAGGLLLPVAMALVFRRQLAEFRDPFVPWTEDAGLLLTGTAWGTTWLWGAGVSVIAATGLTLASAGIRGGWLLGGAGVLALSTFPALTGHANASGPLRPLTLTADTLHLVAAGGWIGTLAFVLYAERGWRRREGLGADSLLPWLVPRFSPLAIACVATLVATGLVGSWVHLPELGALVSTPYGRTLSVKLALVAFVGGMGLLNWRRLSPRLAEAPTRDALRTAASVELLVAHVALLATAVLVRTPPPAG